MDYLRLLSVNSCCLNKNVTSTYFIYPLKVFQPCKNAAILECSCWAPNLLEANTTGSKSLCVLLTAGKVKVTKACHSYLEKCCHVYHSILFWIFLFHTVWKVWVKIHEQDNSEKMKRSSEKWTKVKIAEVKFHANTVGYANNFWSMQYEK